MLAPTLGPLLQIPEVFRRLLLQRLHQAERLSEAFMGKLLTWVHPGFSVFAGPPVAREAIEPLESQARYITRPAPAVDALQKLDDGNLALETPPDPRTGVTSMVLDPLEWIHRITAHIPDPGCHGQRYYGAYSNRARVSAQGLQNPPGHSAEALPPHQDSNFAKEVRKTWARLLTKIFELDPLLCSCGGRMKVVSVITQPRVIDHILRHLRKSSCHSRSPFVPRSPPPPRNVVLQTEEHNLPVQIPSL